VKFGEEQLATVPEAIQKKITLLNKGQYSVSQIILGLSAAGLASFDKESSLFPGVSKDKDIEIFVLNAFKQYLEPYIDWLKTGPFSVLGYAIKVDGAASRDSKLLPPSFPPTAVRVRTQAYIPHTLAFRDTFPVSKSMGLPTRGGLDALIFQEMTEGRAWPSQNYDDTKAGNWITGSVDCSLTLSKHVFWDRYLMKEFAELNEQMLDLANDMIYWVSPNEKRDPNQPWKASKNKPGNSWSGTATGASYSFSGNYDNGFWMVNSHIYTSVDNTMQW
jgi:hypothetical protein